MITFADIGKWKEVTVLSGVTSENSRRYYRYRNKTLASSARVIQSLNAGDEWQIKIKPLDISVDQVSAVYTWSGASDGRKTVAGEVKDVPDVLQNPLTNGLYVYVKGPDATQSDDDASVYDLITLEVDSLGGSFLMIESSV